MWYLYCLLTLYVAIVMLIICLDYYGNTPHEAAKCLFGAEALNWWMVGTWFFHAAWYGVLVIKWHSVRNFFRTACPLAEAEEVMMFQPKEVATGFSCPFSTRSAPVNCGECQSVLCARVRRAREPDVSVGGVRTPCT